MSNPNESSSSGSDERAPPTEAAATPGTLIGYCHQCDRQVEIEQVNFTCTQCHGGFIELFDMDSSSAAGASASSQERPQGRAAFRTRGIPPQPQRVRLDTIRLNQGQNINLANILPLLMPQLAAGGAPGANPAQMMQQLRASLQQQHAAQQAASSGGATPTPTTTDTSAGEGSTESTQQQSQQPQTQAHTFQYGPTTRLQFIVPGEQFDLYGIINNVLSDLFDPTRRQGQQSGQPNAQFQFQAPPIRMFQLHGDLRDYAWGPTGLDSIITQLLNQLENTGPPPASDQQLHNLPTVKISQQEYDKNAQCSICMEDFKIDDEAKRLPCKHLFHEPCIVEWLKLHGTCPVCRKNLNGEDTSQREYISRPPPAGQATAAESGEAQPQAETPSASGASTTSTNQTPGSNTSNNSNNPNQNVYYDMDFD